MLLCVDQEGFTVCPLCAGFSFIVLDFYIYLCKEGFFKAIMLSAIMLVPCSIPGLSAFPNAQPMVKRRAGALEQTLILS